MKSTTDHTHKAHVRAAQAYLREHLLQPIDLQELAREVGASPFHFSRIFAAAVGEPPAAHHRRLRLEWAAGKLSTSDASIAEIALQAGYQNPESFTKAFQRLFGRAPSAYRANPRDQQALTTAQSTAPHPTAEVITRPAMTLLYLTYKGPYHEMGPIWKQLMSYAYSKRLVKFWKRPQTFGICQDNPHITPAEQLTFLCTVAVSLKAKPDGPFGVLNVPEGRYLYARHVGPYSDLEDVYQQLFARIYADEMPLRELAFQSLEQYLNNPNRTPAHKLKTEVLIPVG